MSKSVRYSDLMSFVSKEEKLLYSSEYYLKKWYCENTALLTLAEADSFVHHVLHSKYVRERFDAETRILIVNGRNKSSARASYVNQWGRDVRPTYPNAIPRIRLPRWARNHFTMLHEIAHHLHSYDDRYPWDKTRHDAEFARIQLGLVKEYLPREDYLILKASYTKNKVLP